MVPGIGVPNIATAGVRLVPDPTGFVLATQGVLRSALGGIGGAAALAVPAALAGIAAAGLKVAKDVSDAFVPFEESLTRITTLVGVAKPEVEALGQAVLGLAPAVGRGPLELADALFFITSAGQRGTVALATLEASAKAAALGLGETQTVADAATSAMNAYGEENLSAADAVGILVKAVEQGKLEASSLAQSIGAVIPLASEAGVSFNEVAAALAAVSRTGLDASEGATALRGLLSTIIAPGKQAQTVLAEFGLSAEDLRAAIRDDGLLGALDLLRVTFGDNIEALSSVIPNIRALTGFLSLTGSQAETTAAIFGELADVTGVLDERFSQVEETQAFRRQQADAERMTILIGEGSEAAEALTRLYEQMPGLLSASIPILADIGTEIASALASTLEWVSALREAKREGLFRSLGLTEPDAGDGGSERTEGASLRVRQLADAWSTVGDASNATNDELVVLFETLDASQGLWERFTGRTEAVGETLDRLGLSFADFVDIARTGVSDVDGLFDAIRATTGAPITPDMELRVRGLLPWVEALEEGLRLSEELNRQDYAAFREEFDAVGSTWEALPAVVDGVVDSLNNYGGVISGLRGPDGRILVEFDDLRLAVESAVEETGNLSSALLALTSPGFAALDAVTRFQDAYDAAMRDGTLSDEERLALLRPFLEVQARVDELDPASALLFKDIVSQAWEELGGDTEILFGQGGVIALQIDAFGNVVSDIGPTIVDNASGWGFELGRTIYGETEIALDFVKDALGIRSPSSVWAREVGLPIAAGIAKGFRDGLPLIRAAFAEIPMPSTVGAGTSGGAGGGMNITINNPTGQPAEDSIRQSALRASVVLRLHRPGVN